MKPLLILLDSLGSTGLVCLTSLVILQVVLRNLRIANFPWMDEAARLAHVVTIFILVPLLFWLDKHITAEVFRPTSKTAQSFLKLTSTVASMAFSFLFFFSGIKLIFRLWNVPLAALRIPTLFLYLAPLIGTLLSLLLLSKRFVRERS